MTDKAKDIINTSWSLIPRLFATLGVIGAVVILVLSGEFIFFPFKWLEIVIPLLMIILSFAILVVVAWNEEQY